MYVCVLMFVCVFLTGLIRERMCVCVCLIGPLPAAEKPAAPAVPQAVVADTAKGETGGGAPVRKAPVIVLTGQPGQGAVVANSVKPAPNKGTKDVLAKKLTVNASPFVFNLAVTEFTPGIGPVAAGGERSTRGKGGGGGKQERRKGGEVGEGRGGREGGNGRGGTGVCVHVFVCLCVCV